MFFDSADVPFPEKIKVFYLTRALQTPESDFRAIQSFMAQNPDFSYQPQFGVTPERVRTVLERGDVATIVTPSLSHLAQAKTSLIDILHSIKSFEVRLLALRESYDSANLPVDVLACALQVTIDFEVSLHSEKVRRGMARAQSAGRRISRDKARPSETIRAMLRRRIPHRTIAEVLSLSIGTVANEAKSMKREKGEL